MMRKVQYADGTPGMPRETIAVPWSRWQVPLKFQSTDRKALIILFARVRKPHAKA